MHRKTVSPDFILQKSIWLKMSLGKTLQTNLEWKNIAVIIFWLQKAHKRAFEFNFYRYRLEWIRNKMGFETSFKK